MSRFAYYPGCCSESSGAEYMRTTEMVFAGLGHALDEIEDWNCCGASSAHAISPYLALALPGRDLQKAEKMGLDIIAPCASCFNRLATAAHELPGRSSIGGEPLPAFEGRVSVYHPTRVLATAQNLAALSAALTQRLGGLPVVTYYGCLTVRPAEITGASGTEIENPTSMDRILDVLGAEVLDWPHKTSCCGAAQSLPNPDIAKGLTMGIVEGALETGAKAMVTGCPLCHLNLEIQQLQRQREPKPPPLMPAFTFTELMALCMGLPKLKRVFRRHLVPVDGLLAEWRLSWK